MGFQIRVRSVSHTYHSKTNAKYTSTTTVEVFAWNTRGLTGFVDDNLYFSATAPGTTTTFDWTKLTWGPDRCGNDLGSVTVTDPTVKPVGEERRRLIESSIVREPLTPSVS